MLPVEDVFYLMIILKPDTVYHKGTSLIRYFLNELRTYPDESL